MGSKLLRWSLLVIMAASLCLHEVVGVKRTMPMIGMDEDGEEVDPEDDLPATQQPRNALQSLIDGFLGKVSALYQDGLSVMCGMAIMSAVLQSAQILLGSIVCAHHAV